MSDKNDKIIIIGNGIAGTTAAAEIRKKNSDCTVMMISNEKIIGYNRPMLTKSIAKDIDEKAFYIKPQEWYSENNIDILLDTTVGKIDKDKKTVMLNPGEIKGEDIKDGDTKDYDKLILATGASAFVPPIPGKDVEGVFSIRNIDDIQRLKELTPTAKNAVVIGGGVLGLEAAWDLTEVIENVTVLERSGGMMSRQLDAKGSEFLKKAADEIGLNVLFEVDTDEILSKDGKVTGIKLKDGNEIKADIVVISTGIKRNIQLAEDAGLEVGRGIVVNEHMETSAKDIYAAGDCAEYDGVSYGIIPEATEMAKVAGANCLGENLSYKPITPANAFNVKNISLYAIGDNGKNKDLNYDTYEKVDEEKGIYEKFYFVDDKLVGGILIGSMGKTMKLLDGFKYGERKDEFLAKVK